MEAWHVNTLFSSLPLLPPESGAVEDAEFRTFITFSEMFLFLISEEAARRGHENSGWTGLSETPSRRHLGAQVYPGPSWNILLLQCCDCQLDLKCEYSNRSHIFKGPELCRDVKFQLACDVVLFRRFSKISWKRGRSSSSEGLGSGSPSPPVPEKVSVVQPRQFCAHPLLHFLLPAFSGEGEVHAREGGQILL